METDRAPDRSKLDTLAEREQQGAEEEKPEAMSPNNSNLLRDQIRGTSTEHASPPRLEDEGQSGG